MTKYHLMVKIALPSGLKYLCKCSDNKDPYAYKGSGTRWTNHIKAHGSHIVTWVIATYNTKQELKEAGLHYSTLYNVVESDKWANLIPEQGDGGLIGAGQLGKTWKVSDQGRRNMSEGKKRLYATGYRSNYTLISGANNYQFAGYIKTPWGVFDSKQAASNHPDAMIKTLGTIKRYVEHLDKPLNPEGRRTPRAWRGKTPREVGFDILKENE